MENKLVFEPTTLTQYHWNKYNIETTYTYYWKIYTAIEDYLYTYFWNKYEVLPTQAPTWNKYDAAKEYAYKYYWDMYNATQKAHKHYKRYKSYPLGDWTLNWDKAVAKYRISKTKSVPAYGQVYNIYRTTDSSTYRTYYKGDMFLKMKPDRNVSSSESNFYLYWDGGYTVGDNKRISPIGIYSNILPKNEVEGYKIRLHSRLGNMLQTLDILPYDIDTGLPDTSDSYYGRVYPWGCDTLNSNTSGFCLKYSDYMFYASDNTAYAIIPNSYFDWDTGRVNNVVRLMVETIPDNYHYDEYHQWHNETYRTWSMGRFDGYLWMPKNKTGSFTWNDTINPYHRMVLANNTNDELLVVGHTEWYPRNESHEVETDYGLYCRIYNTNKELSDYDVALPNQYITGIQGYQRNEHWDDFTNRIYSNTIFNNENVLSLNNIGVDYDIDWKEEYHNSVYLTQKAITSNKVKTGNKIGTYVLYGLDTSWFPEYFIEKGNYYFSQVEYEYNTWYFEKVGSPQLDIDNSIVFDVENIITTNLDYYPNYDDIYIDNRIPYIVKRYNAGETYYGSSDFSDETLTLQNRRKPTPSDYHQTGYNIVQNGYIYLNPTITLDNIDYFVRNNEFVQDDYCETNQELPTEDYIVDNTNFIYNYRQYIGVEHYWEKGSSTGQQVSSFTRTDYPDNGAQDGRWYIYKTKNMEETGGYVKGSTSYGKIYSANTNTYPQNGKQGDYWYIYAGLTTLPIEQRLQLLGEVSANNRNQYPDDGVHSDSYYYRYTDFTRDVIGYHRGEDTGQTVSSSKNTTYPMNDVMDDIWYSYDYSVPHYNRGSLIDNVSSYIETSYPRNNYILNDAWYIYTGSVEVITGQLTIDNTQLMGGVNYTQEINPSEDLMIGAGGAAQVDFTIYAPDAAAVVQYLGKDFTYYVKMNSDEDWRQVGVFTLTKADLPDKQTAKIEGFDYIYKFDVNVDEWLDGLTFPMTLGDFFNSLCQYVGCEAYSTEFNNSNFVVNDNFEAVQITGRTILQYITEVSGGFCVAEPDGRIHIKQYSIPPTGTINLGNDSYVKYTHEIYNVPVITSVVVRKDDEDEGVESNV